MRACVVALLIGVSALIATSAVSAQLGRAANNRFAGVWQLVGEETRDANGQIVPRGADASRFGYIVYDPAGYVSVMLSWLKQPTFAGGKATTPQEALAALGAYNWYWGSFAVNEARSVVTHQTFGAVSPAFSGSNQERKFTISGNRLTLQPPTCRQRGSADADLGARPRFAEPHADASEVDRLLEADLVRGPQRQRRPGGVEPRSNGIHRLHRVGTRDGAHDAAVPPAERGPVADAGGDDGDVSELHELFRAVHRR